MSSILQDQYLLIAAILAVLFAIATLSDLRSRKIPNHLVVKGILLAWAVHLFSRLQVEPVIIGFDWRTPAFGMLAGMAALMPLYLLRACGAGDVKLMAMVGAFVGPTTVLYAALYTLMAGGVLSLVYMLFTGVAVQTLQNVRFMLTDLMVRARTGGGAYLEPMAVTAARLPYAVAITAGTFTALLRHNAM